jgi:flavin-dependent dehydrogenase
VGDAFGFLDPIYSSGVLLALKSGELAADSIDSALAAGDPSGARLGAHGPRFAAGMEAMRKLVYAFYEQDFSFAKFLARYPEHRLNIIHLLVGDVEHPIDGLFDAMSWMVRFPEEVELQPPTETAAASGAGR